MNNLFYPYNLSFSLCKYSWLTLFLTVLVAITSCKKNFTSNQFIDDKLVVLAEITAGDSMEIPIGKTIKVGNGGLIRFEKVNDATANLTDAIGNSFMLQPNYSVQYSGNPTAVFTNRRHFRSNTTYFIEIKHPTLGTVTASTHIPAIIKSISIDTNSEVYLGKALLAATIRWQDDPLNSNYYVIEALKETVKINKFFYYRGIRYNYEMPEGKALYEQVRNAPGVMLLRDTIPQNKFTRINLYTDDINSENSRIDNLNHPFRRIFIPDHNFIGQRYETKIFIDPQFFISTELKKKGRVRLQVKSCSKELYDYLLIYEKFKTDFGSVPSSQLISPVGNIQNGLGIFGGSSKREHIYYFDTL